MRGGRELSKSMNLTINLDESDSDHEYDLFGFRRRSEVDRTKPPAKWVSKLEFLPKENGRKRAREPEASDQEKRERAYYYKGSYPSLQVMLEEALLSDLTFVLGEEEIPAHKCIVAAMSPVFKAMFQNEMLEHVTSRVVIDDINADPFRCFLRYLYYGKIFESEIREHGVELLRACNKYQVTELTQQCGKVLAESITKENCLDLLHHGGLYEPRLQEHCKKFIARHWGDVVETKSFAAMCRDSHSFMVDVVRLMSSNKNNRELKLSFSPSLDGSYGHFTLKLPRDSTVSELVAEVKAHVQVSPSEEVHFFGIEGHRITKLYSLSEKIENITDHLKVEICSSHSLGRKVSISHALIVVDPGFPDYTCIEYFGQPYIQTLPSPTADLKQLKESAGFNAFKSTKFKFVSRSLEDPYSEIFDYLDNTSRVRDMSGNFGDKFIALIHPTCTCSVPEGAHSALYHLW